MLTKQVRGQHLLWRCGFGVAVADFPALQAGNLQKLYDAVEQKSLPLPEYIDVAASEAKSYTMDMRMPGKAPGIKDTITAEQRKQLRMQTQEDFKRLILTWLDTMVNSEAQLREKMAFFWHGHFACRVENSYNQQLLLNDIRINALGNFGDLLKAVSKSASMLQFLNNQQNHKEHPNENFAREVMELFTLGRGNYTENDVKEAARAFTGWGYDLDGTFKARPFFHDKGSKTIVGKTGNFDGDDVLNILLEQKQTAVFITRKIYRYFVNDTVDPKHADWLADRFYQSNYDIKGLMRDIFTADWFYEEKNVGKKIKSPVELIVGIRRLLPMTIQNPDMQMTFQRVLGQLLFNPPNVAGWPGGKNWIDSSTLMVRLRLPQLIKENETFTVQPKADDDKQMGMKDRAAVMAAAAPNKNPFQIQAAIDWNTYLNNFSRVPREELYNSVESVVLQTSPGQASKTAVQQMINNKSREEYIKTATIALMSTPEYQLC